jgi:hypothetical protein
MKAAGSQRTGDDEGPVKAPSSSRTEAIKRGANTAYLTMRLARDHPQILARLQAGEFPNVRAAAKAAGLIKALTPLEKLERAWRRADSGDRHSFLVGMHSETPITLHGATPLPKGLRRGQVWDFWLDQLNEIRQHLYRVQDAGVPAKVARARTSQARQQYIEELRHLIEDLTTILGQLERVTARRRDQQQG